VLLSHKIWNKQPNKHTRLNRQSSLTTDLWEGISAVDAAFVDTSGASLLYQTGTFNAAQYAQKVNAAGISIYSTTGSTSVWYGLNGRKWTAAATASWSATCVVTLSATGNSVIIGGSTDDRWLIGIVSNAFVYRERYVGDASITTYITDPETIVANKLYVLTCVHEAGVGCYLYKNGALVGFTSKTANHVTTVDGFRLYSYPNANLGLLHTRALSGAEVSQLHSNPWQVFQPRHTYLPVSSIISICFSKGTNNCGTTSSRKAIIHIGSC